jgi:hypothetical protein
MAFGVPVASIDTIAPALASLSRSSGIALIALVFPSTARGVGRRFRFHPLISWNRVAFCPYPCNLGDAVEVAQTANRSKMFHVQHFGKIR